MAFDHIKNVKISAVCCAVPEDKLTIDDFYQRFDKERVDRFVVILALSKNFIVKTIRL